MTITHRASSWFLAAIVGLATQLSADEPRPNQVDKLTTLLVTIKQVTKDGRSLNETSTYVAQYPGRRFEGTVPLHMDGPGKSHLFIVAFEASPTQQGAVIRFEVSDTSKIKQGMVEGTGYALPLKILDVVRPRKRSEIYTIYSVGTGKVVIAFQPIEESSIEAGAPETPHKSREDKRPGG